MGIPTNWRELKTNYGAWIMQSDRGYPAGKRRLELGDSLAQPRRDRIPFAMIAVDPTITVTAQHMGSLNNGAIDRLNTDGTGSYSVDNTNGNANGNRYTFPGTSTSEETMGLPLFFHVYPDAGAAAANGRFVNSTLWAYQDGLAANNNWTAGTSHRFIDTSETSCAARWLFYCPEAIADLPDFTDLLIQDLSATATTVGDTTSNNTGIDLRTDAYGSYINGDTRDAATTPRAGRVNAIFPDSYCSTPNGNGSIVCRVASATSSASPGTNEILALAHPMYYLVDVESNVATWRPGTFVQCIGDGSWNYWDQTSVRPTGWCARDEAGQYPTGADPQYSTDATIDDDLYKVCRFSDLLHCLDQTTLDPAQPLDIYVNIGSELASTSTPAELYQAWRNFIDNARTMPSYGFTPSVRICFIQQPLIDIGDTDDLDGIREENGQIGVVFAQLAIENSDIVCSVHLPAILGNHYFGTDHATVDPGAAAWLAANVPSVPMSETALDATLTYNTDYTADLYEPTTTHPSGLEEARVLGYLVHREIRDAVPQIDRNTRTRYTRKRPVYV